MIRRPPRSTLSSSSAASDVYKRQDGYSTNNISFTYFNSPNVTSIFPTAGPVKGGTTITVHLGRELLSELPSTICKFGHTLTSAAVWLDPAKLSCLSPMFHAETLANFSLSFNQQGSTPVSSLLQYYAFAEIYRGQLSDVHPKSVDAAGGTSITVSGSNFRSFAPNPFGCKIGSQMIQPLYANQTHVICVTDPILTSELSSTDPSAPPEVGLELVVNGVDLSLNALTLSVFNYSTPSRFDRIRPTFGPPLGGTIVTVTGAGFVNSSSMLCGVGLGVLADPSTSQAYYMNSSQLVCATPPSPGGDAGTSLAFNLSVSLDDGQNFFEVPALPGLRASKVFLYKPKVRIVAEPHPSAGPVTGGNLVTISGSGFVAPTSTIPTCRFGTQVVAASNTTVNETTGAAQVVCVSPPAINKAAGRVSLEVAANAVQFSDSHYMFEYSLPIGRSASIVNATAFFPSFDPSDFDSVLISAFVLSIEQAVPTMPASALTIVRVGGGDASPNGNAASLRRQPSAGATVFFTIAHFGLPADQVVTELEASFAGSGSSGFSEVFATNAISVGKLELIQAKPIGTVTLQTALLSYLVASPTCGPSNGGTVVTVVGSGFVNSSTATARLVCTATSSGVTAAVTTSATYQSPTIMTLVTPARSGAANCTGAIGNNPQTFAPLSFSFQYYQDPTIAKAQPSSAPFPGGTLVSLWPTPLDSELPSLCGLQPQCVFEAASHPHLDLRSNATLVAVNGSATMAVQCHSPAISNMSMAFSTNLRVSFNRQQNSVSYQDFSVYPSNGEITSVTPTQAAAGLPTQVTIAGNALQPSTEAVCRWGTESQGPWFKVPYITPATYVSSSGAYTCDTPSVNGSLNGPGTNPPLYQAWEIPGVVQASWRALPATVTQLELAINGEDYLNSSLRFELYNLSSVKIDRFSPNSFESSGQTKVTITGSNFVVNSDTRVRFKLQTEDATVLFADYSPTTWVYSSTQIAFPAPRYCLRDDDQCGKCPSFGSCDKPDFPYGAVDVEITFDGQNYVPTVLAGSYIQPPDPRTLSVYLGPLTGSTVVTVQGSKFVSTGFTACRFGNNLNPHVYARVLTESSVACSTPPRSGPVVTPVWVSLDGQNFQETLHQFKFVYFSLPQPTSVTPNMALRTESVNVTVTGTDFVKPDTYGVQPRCRWVSSELDERVMAATYTVDGTSLICLTPPNNFMTGLTTFSISFNGRQNWIEVPNGFTFLEVPFCWTCPEVVAPPTHDGTLTIFTKTRRRRYTACEGDCFD
eukprot:TRINITY_DN4865_c0_g1_i2.p1 TRINITY_DN4865_c0_g1~~TRINITY_DN4865_c0_g1_i2.p1  ORF type:complete len:1261 (-),score=246.57 TRINITY_DN4865_c0_g1_i2:310-4092(-)